MTITQKKGLFKRLFGVKESGCCNVKIEEINEDVDQEKQLPEASPSCCKTDTES